MIPLPIWVYAAAAAVLLSIGGWGGWKVTSNHYKAEMLEAERAQAAAFRAEVGRLNDASAKLEDKKDEAKVRTRIIVKRVAQIVEKPVYRNDCIDDDGLRLANAALAGKAPDSGKPDAPLPIGTAPAH